MKTDLYVVDTLMRDLVAHSRSAAAFLVYLQLYRHTHGSERESVAVSHAVLAEMAGLSKRSVQTAIAHFGRPAIDPQAPVTAHGGSGLYRFDSLGPQEPGVAGRS